MHKHKLSQKEIKAIADLAATNTSLKTISKILKRGKTTVYYHFRKVRGNTMQPVAVDSSNEELVGEFMGLFAGDGCATKNKNYVY